MLFWFLVLITVAFVIWGFAVGGFGGGLFLGIILAFLWWGGCSIKGCVDNKEKTVFVQSVNDFAKAKMPAEWQKRDAIVNAIETQQKGLERLEGELKQAYPDRYETDPELIARKNELRTMEECLSQIDTMLKDTYIQALKYETATGTSEKRHYEETIETCVNGINQINIKFENLRKNK